MKSSTCNTKRYDWLTERILWLSPICTSLELSSYSLKGRLLAAFPEEKNSFQKHSPAVTRVGFITYHFLGCFADWRVPRSNILLHLHPSWSLEHEAGISKHNRGLKLSAALASTIEAWSSVKIRLEKQKIYRLALLPPSRLAAFLNTGSF